MLGLDDVFMIAIVGAVRFAAPALPYIPLALVAFAAINAVDVFAAHAL